MKISDIIDNKDFFRNDKIKQRKKHDTRKAKITLRELNRLRKIRQYQKLQIALEGDKLEIMYGEKDGGSSSDMGGFM